MYYKNILRPESLFSFDDVPRTKCQTAARIASSLLTRQKIFNNNQQIIVVDGFFHTHTVWRSHSYLMCTLLIGRILGTSEFDLNNKAIKKIFASRYVYTHLDSKVWESRRTTGVKRENLAQSVTEMLRSLQSGENKTPLLFYIYITDTRFVRIS